MIPDLLVIRIESTLKNANSSAKLPAFIKCDCVIYCLALVDCGLAISSANYADFPVITNPMTGILEGSLMVYF